MLYPLSYEGARRPSAPQPIQDNIGLLTSKLQSSLSRANRDVRIVVFAILGHGNQGKPLLSRMVAS